MKVVRLNEKDLQRIVKRVIKESGEKIETDDAYWIQAKENLTCKDCGEWNAMDEPMFMVNNDIWDEYGNEEDMICPGCLEKRMRRKLKKDDISDYSDAPVNIENPYIQSLTESNIQRIVKIVLNEEANKRILGEQDPFQKEMSGFADQMNTDIETANINDRVGKENYDAIKKIAENNGMTKEPSSGRSDYFKWTKDLGEGNQLVLIILNGGTTKYHGGVTSYIDRDDGKYLEVISGKLVKTGEGNMGTYPSFEDITHLSLMMNNKNISDQPNQLQRLENNIKKKIK
jgi:hypothetical protein